MILLCVDGAKRDFVPPAYGLNTKTQHKPAFCKNCLKTFGYGKLFERKEELRKHICYR